MAFYSADEVATQEVSDKITRRVVSGEKVMMTLLEVAAGAVVDPHRHNDEQIVYVLNGAMRFRLEEEEREMGAGDFVVIPSNAEHSAKVLADMETIEAFSPIRPEFLKA